jgi:hypothetical protein
VTRVATKAGRARGGAWLAIVVGVCVLGYGLLFRAGESDFAPIPAADPPSVVPSRGPVVDATIQPALSRESATESESVATPSLNKNVPSLDLEAIASFKVRLVREDRTPLASAAVLLARDETDGSGMRSVSSIVTTNGDGYVTFEAAAIDPEKIRVIEASFPPYTPERTGRLDFSRPFPLGENDLGELVLVEAARIASGRVIDGAGDPVSGAIVTLHWKNDGIKRRAITPIFEPSQLTATSRIDGTFTLYGEWEGELALVARNTALGESARQPIVHGQTGIELRLAPMGAIRGSVRVPHGFVADQINAVLFDPTVFDFSFRSGESRPLGRNGSFRFDQLGAGIYSVRFECTHPDPLLVVNEVVVRSGETTLDPRLQDVGLDSAIGVLDVVIVDVSGAPLGAQLMVRARTRDHSVGAKLLGTGMWRVITHPLGQDLVVSRPGYVPRWIRDVRPANEPFRVVLEECAAARIRIAGECPLVRHKFRLTLVLKPEPELWEAIPDPLENYVSIVAEVGDDRLATLRIPFPGRYRVSFVARERFGSFNMDFDLPGEAFLDFGDARPAETALEVGAEVREYFEKG